jgi:hypothetical protein
MVRFIEIQNMFGFLSVGIYIKRRRKPPLVLARTRTADIDRNILFIANLP